MDSQGIHKYLHNIVHSSLRYTVSKNECGTPTENQFNKTEHAVHSYAAGKTNYTEIVSNAEKCLAMLNNAKQCWASLS